MVSSFLALDATRSVRDIGEGFENSGGGGPTADSLSTYSHKDSLGDPQHLHVKILR